MSIMHFLRKYIRPIGYRIRINTNYKSNCPDDLMTRLITISTNWNIITETVQKHF